ncbi:MAG: hypothetical protein E7426_05635 [Ruminococcaceae bacterium]|nr:hypothetical protein [Oscillospiraceae bacterium]
MFFPRLTAPALRRTAVTAFAGYDRRTPLQPGAFAHTENLCADGWPALTVRPRRAVAATLHRPNGLTAKDALIWVDGGTLYINGLATGLQLTDGPKQLVGMGAYLVIWPDKMYIDTARLSDFGPLERTVTTSASVSWAPCRADGAALTYASGAAEPAGPRIGALWLDTGVSPAVLRQYGADGWQTLADTYTALRCPGIGAGFSAGDAVDISGCAAEELNGSFLLQSVADDALVVAALAEAGSQSGAVTVSRTVPDMDYVVECGNRLWGCKYGLADGKTVNEIYASKLGDFKNWRVFQGLSTDSYAAGRGSDGAFTGAAAYLGSPLFFKEHCIERVYPEASGAHQIVTLQCDGVKQGSAASLQVVDGTLYYHGVHGVCAFSGSLPSPVSAALGDTVYHGAVAGAWRGQYWVSMADESGAWHLLVYDVRRRLWHRQDATRAAAFAAADGELYCLEGDTGRLLALHGLAGTPEEGSVRWAAESGDLGLTEDRSRYLQRLTVHASVPAGASVTAAVSYDGGETWESQGTVTGGGAAAQRALLHVRPRRCERLRLRLSGTGAVKVYSLTALYGKGSDGP